jgi:plastocyanin
MGDFNLNPIPHNPIAKVTNDRNPKREQKKEEDKKKEKDKAEKDSFASIEQLEEQKSSEPKISTDSFSVGEEPPKPGYTVDWVKMNNMKHDVNKHLNIDGQL